MIKKISVIIVAIIALLLLSATLLYYLYLSPQKRAAAHLEFAHQAIDEVHPAILEDGATEFHAWHNQGYEQAKKLLPLIKTEGDVSAIMRFYLEGYRDSHLGGAPGRTPYSRIDSKQSLWTGWIINATQQGYYVQFAKQGDQYPPLNAQLLTCDNQAIDDLLKEHFSPYLDRRWHILSARQLSAMALSQQRNFISILNRPTINKCTFDIKGTQKSYPLTWQSIEVNEIEAIKATYNPAYKLPGVKELSPGVLWVTASDFQLNSPEAARSQQQLLDDLNSFKEKKIIIFDVRLNAGGSSSHGFNIISRALDDNDKNYLSKEWDLRNEGADAQFRASWRLYWDYDDRLKQVIKNQGAESSPARFLGAAKEKIKQTLDNGENHFYQSEISINQVQNSSKNSTSSIDWKSSTQVALLTSSRCSSACLDFVDMLKLIPNLIHLGEPTNADTSYIEVARMQSHYFGETFSLIVPAKKWNKRMRKDNVPYIPDILYSGNIYDDPTVEKWALEQIRQKTQLLGSNP